MSQPVNLNSIRIDIQQIRDLFGFNPNRIRIYGLSFIIMFLSINMGLTQNSNLKPLQQGDALFQAGKFKDAINKYLAAEAMDPSQRSVVSARLNEVLQKIEQLQAEALVAKQEAELREEELREALLIIRQYKRFPICSAQ